MATIIDRLQCTSNCSLAFQHCSSSCDTCIIYFLNMYPKADHRQWLKCLISSLNTILYSWYLNMNSNVDYLYGNFAIGTKF